MKTLWVWLIAAMLSCPAWMQAKGMEDKADALLREALASKNPDTRKTAVVALSLAASRGPYLETLLQMLNDKDVEVQLATISSLSEMNNKTVKSHLRKSLDDEVPEVGFAAAKALWKLHDPIGKKALMAIVQGENEASSSFWSKQKRDALRMMHTPRTALMFAARQGAAFVPVPGLGGGIASMQAILTDPDVSGRAAAALLVCQERDRKTLEAFKDALYVKDASLRATAVHCLALRNNPGLRREIEPLLDDEKEAVRLRAAAAYLRLSTVQKRPAQAAGQP